MVLARCMLAGVLAGCTLVSLVCGMVHKVVAGHQWSL